MSEGKVRPGGLHPLAPRTPSSSRRAAPLWAKRVAQAQRGAPFSPRRKHPKRSAACWGDSARAQ